MTILFFNDGRLLIDAEEPLENVDLRGLIGCIADAKPGDALMYNGSMWVNGASALYLDEAEGDNDTVILTATYAAIKAAIDAGRAVLIRSESSGTYTLAPLATYGGDDDTGYTVTVGEATYTAATADGVLTKQAAGGE